jgi:hypothetical protein
LFNEALKALAAPRKAVVIVDGTPILASSFWMAATAAPRETPGAVSNEILAAGNWAT